MINKSLIELTIVIPTLNEGYAITPLLNDLLVAFCEYEIEIIVVDGGSDDKTPEIVRKIAEQNPEIYLLNCKSMSLLASVAIGIVKSRSEYIIVMDGDGQHKPTDAVQLFLRLKTSENTDIVCGVRDLQHGGQTELSGSLSFIRSSISATINRVLLELFNIQTKDPLTGFFCFRSDKVNATQLTRGDGFKILLEILLNNRELKTVDQKINFAPRLFGQSKLNVNTILFFIAQCISHLTHRIVSERILIFCAIGGFVLGFHTLIFFGSQTLFSLATVWCHFNAVFISSTLSFYLNSKITFSSVPTRFKAKYLAALTFVIVNLVLTFPNIVLFYELLSNFVGIPVLWLSLVTIPADTILKFLLVRKIVWKL